MIVVQTAGSTGIPSRYHVSGVIQLPYAEISEPFESWIDVNLGFSRIDYYGGVVVFLLVNPEKNNRFVKLFQVLQKHFNAKVVRMEIMEQIIKLFPYQVNRSSF